MYVKHLDHVRQCLHIVGAVLSIMPALKEFAVQEGKTGHTEERVINGGWHI